MTASPQRGDLWLGAGAFVGLAIALVGLVWPSSPRGLEQSGDVVARVDGRAIPRAEFERAWTALRSDSRGLDDAAVTQRVMGRIIDEELLLRHASELGLHEREPALRASMVDAAIRTITLEAEEDADSVDLDTLRAFYDANPGLFGAAPRLHAQRWFFSAARAGDADARERAALVAGALREGRALDPALPDPPIAPLPDGLLPPSKVREYLGPTATARLASMELGEVSEPIGTTGGYAVVRLVERVAEPPRPFEAVTGTVRATWRRRQGEEALRAWLDRRRTEVSIEVVDEVSRP